MPRAQTDKSVREAYDYCRHITRAHYENFLVAPLFLPREKRDALCAIYAFARGTDDIGDEASPPTRIKHLDKWEYELKRAVDGGGADHPVFIALKDAMERHALSAEPFLALIRANRMDQVNTRYRAFSDLLNYCEHSANPVGRIVLALWDYRDDERILASDEICTALQLANFWQDIFSDYHKRGRIYISKEDMEKFAVSEEDIANSRVSDNFKNLMKFEIERTRKLFENGSRLEKVVKKPLSSAVRIFIRGGVAALDKIEKYKYDVFSKIARVGKFKKFMWLAEGLLKQLTGTSRL